MIRNAWFHIVLVIVATARGSLLYQVVLWVNVVILDGIMGAGKTLGMTLLTKHFQRKSGCALYSNYGIYDSKPFHSYLDFMSVAKESSSILALDESHTDLDARNFNTNSVKFFTHLVFYLRKIRCTVFLATPLINNLDGRVIGVGNLYCRCSKDKEYFYYDLFDLQSGRHLKRYRIKREKAYALGASYYDTYSMVTPMEFPSERADFKTFLTELKETSEEFYRQRQARGGIGFQPKPVERILEEVPV